MPNVLQITYTCMKCGREEEEIKSFICKCGGEFRGTGMPALNNTRDSFGIGKDFYDVKTGKYIDNFKSWEKAGFKEPGAVEGKNSRQIKDQVKEIKKRKTFQNRASKALNLAERI
jgi:hypothetical protein